MAQSGSGAIGTNQGTVSQITTGAGLTGGPITGTGTLSVASVDLTAQVVGLLPQANNGIVNTSWAAYNPTLNASLATIASANVAMWKRVGDTLMVQGGYIVPSTTSSTDNITVTIPATLVIDTTKISTGTLAGNNTGPLLGPSLWFQQGTGWRPIYSTYSNTTTIRFFEIDQVFGANQPGAGDGFHYQFTVPIVGW